MWDMATVTEAAKDLLNMKQGPCESSLDHTDSVGETIFLSTFRLHRTAQLDQSDDLLLALTLLLALLCAL